MIIVDQALVRSFACHHLATIRSFGCKPPSCRPISMLRLLVSILALAHTVPLASADGACDIIKTASFMRPEGAIGSGTVFTKLSGGTGCEADMNFQLMPALNVANMFSMDELTMGFKLAADPCGTIASVGLEAYIDLPGGAPSAAVSNLINQAISTVESAGTGALSFSTEASRLSISESVTSEQSKEITIPIYRLVPQALGSVLDTACGLLPEDVCRRLLSPPTQFYHPSPFHHLSVYLAPIPYQHQYLAPIRIYLAPPLHIL